MRAWEWSGSCGCRWNNPRSWLRLESPQVVFVNNDDDNANGVEDRLDAAVAGEDDLCSVVASFDPPAATNGTLTLRIISGNDKVAAWQSCGKSVSFALPQSHGAEMFAALAFFLEGIAVSDAVDDVCIEWEYSEECGRVHAVTQSLTVAEVKHETFSETPSNRERLTLGVGEQVIFYSEPEGLITNSYCSAGATSNLVEYGEVVFSAMSTGGLSDVSIDCNGALLHYVFSVVEPAGFVVDEVKPFVKDIPNQSGDFILLFFNRILPADVSFYAVETLEIPLVATNAIGYYAQPSMSDSIDHGKNGAGNWCGVGDDNGYGDYVSVGENPPPWLDGGSFTWPIPFAWRHQKDACVTNVFCSFEQRFELDCDGTSRVKKFGYCGERATNNVFRLTRED